MLQVQTVVKITKRHYNPIFHDEIGIISEILSHNLYYVELNDREILVHAKAIEPILSKNFNETY